MSLVQRAFSVVCNLCSKPRFLMKSGVFVCEHCDYAINTEGQRSSIPNKDS